MGNFCTTLKVGDRIMVGDAEILLTDSDRGRASFSIKAPKEVKIEKIKTLVEEVFQNENKNRN